MSADRLGIPSSTPTATGIAAMTTTVETVPVTIIGGYLGAGKTTLLNTLLRQNHDLRLAILVNDFGSINIDAELISSHDGETISLTNGCVCCSMVDNLAMTLLELLEREHPPQQIVIEASGVADPGRIAFYGAAEPRLRLDGLIVVADAETIRARLDHKYVGELVLRQLAAADLIVLSKTDLTGEPELAEVRSLLNNLVPQARVASSIQGQLPVDVLLGIRETSPHATMQSSGADPAKISETSHPFSTWHFVSERPFDTTRLNEVLGSLPDSVLRAKGTAARSR